MRLKEIRQEKGISLRRLGRITKISHSYLSQLENGYAEATEGKIIRLSLALNVTPNDLLGYDDILNDLKSNLL